jgi:hypothetical protein
MADRRDYLHLNPFLSNAVPEETFWQPDAEFLDVTSIHQAESQRLTDELANLVANDAHAASTAAGLPLPRTSARPGAGRVTAAAVGATQTDRVPVASHFANVFQPVWRQNSAASVA